MTDKSSVREKDQHIFDLDSEGRLVYASIMKRKQRIHYVMQKYDDADPNDGKPRFIVFQSGNGESGYGLPCSFEFFDTVTPDWNKPLYKTRDGAIEYAKQWLGDYSRAIPSDWTGEDPLCFNGCDGCDIWIETYFPRLDFSNKQIKY